MREIYYDLGFKNQQLESLERILREEHTEEEKKQMQELRKFLFEIGEDPIGKEIDALYQKASLTRKSAPFK
jgi:ferritin